MFTKLVIFIYFFFTSTKSTAASDENLSFIYNDGFKSADLSMEGAAQFTPNGLLRLTNDTSQQIGHAFYPNPITFKNSSSNNASAFSFSTTFVFAIRSRQGLSGQGMVFVVAPTRGLPGAFQSQFLGLFNKSTNGNDDNHVVGVELDTNYNVEFDINGNHVGIDINDLKSVISKPAGYSDGESRFRNVTLDGGEPIQVWVEYDGKKKQMNVSLAPPEIGKPLTPLLSLNRDLSPIFKNTMYVGFTSSTGLVLMSHYVLGWSFKMNGEPQQLVLSRLPELPPMKVGSPKGRSSAFLKFGVPLIAVCLTLVAILGGGVVFYVVKRKREFAELVEDWEVNYGPQRYAYKDLYLATKGFREEQVVGRGGFGWVYRGMLPNSNSEIAVKRVSRESRQGMREFVAEIASMGRLRHRNLVSLLGYCRRKGELLLVYDYMPNGSLDKYLHDTPKTTLGWSQRFRIIRGVASGLLYLHEEWEQMVIHRDVKASNVLLDHEFNARLGDFGLSRLYDHGQDPRTTRIAGTFGYLAPEHVITGRATTKTDVYAFGAFLLEVACGKRPVQMSELEDTLLVNRVFCCWKENDIVRARDPNLGSDFVAEEVELVLKLGLICTHWEPTSRPSMRQVVQCLEGGGGSLPHLPNFLVSGNVGSSGLAFANPPGFRDIFQLSFPSSMDQSDLSYPSLHSSSS